LGRRRRLGRRGLRVGRDHDPPGHERVRGAVVVERPFGRELQPEGLFAIDRPGVEASELVRGHGVPNDAGVRPADGRSRRHGQRRRREREVPDLGADVAGLARLDRRPGRTVAVPRCQPGEASDNRKSRQGGKCSHLRTYGRGRPPVSWSEIGYIRLVKKTAAAELVHAATRLDSPQRALAAITELRLRLDELEALHVEQAIDAGLSWAQIAEHLGVSKQAAHKKHAKSVRRHRKESAGEDRRRRRNVRLGA